MITKPRPARGWAPPRKRPKRLRKKLERRQSWGIGGYQEKYLRLTPAQTEELFRQMANPPPLSRYLVEAMRLATNAACAALQTP